MCPESRIWLLIFQKFSGGGPPDPLLLQPSAKPPHSWWLCDGPVGYSNVCSSCYVMKQQASLSLLISRPASRRWTEKEEVLEQSALFSTVEKRAWRMSRSLQNVLNPIILMSKNFLAHAVRSQSASPIDNSFRRPCLWRTLKVHVPTPLLVDHYLAFIIAEVHVLVKIKCWTRNTFNGLPFSFHSNPTNFDFIPCVPHVRKNW